MKCLQELGLTKYEDKIYTSLLRNGQSTGKEISELSGVPQTAVYPNLKTLLKKQLIQKIDANTARYSPLPPSSAIKSLIARKQKKLETLKEQTIKEAESLSEEKPLKEKEILHLTRGKEPSAEVYYSLIKKVRKTFYVLGWRFEKVGDLYNFLRELKKRIKKGIDARIIVTGNYHKQEELVKIYKKEGIKLRYFPINNLSILIADEKECKITLKNRDLSEKYNLYILDADLSGALNNYFLDTWEKASEIDVK